MIRAEFSHAVPRRDIGVVIRTVMVCVPVLIVSECPDFSAASVLPFGFP